MRDVHDPTHIVRRLLSSPVLTLALALIACSNPVRSPDGADLEHRVQAWWAAREAGDLAGMYALFEPSFRARTPLSEFANDARRMSRIAIEKPRIVSISRSPNSNRAVVTVKAQTMLPRAGQLVDIEIPDEWTLEDGQWWRVYVAPRMPFQ